MEFKTTLEIVTKDIQDIEKLVSNFKNYSRIPNIELDLALSRLRNVYDLLLLFKSDSGSLTEIPVTPDQHLQKPQPQSVVKVKAVEVPSAPVPDPPAVLPSVSSPVAETQSSGSPEESPDIMSKPAEDKKPEEEKKFINEKLGEQVHKKDLSSKLQGKAIKSISGSLGINDKFFFIRELFAGNAETFRQTMDELDESHNFNQAHSLLMERFQWDMESEPVQMLLNLIRRKFITSGNE